jgi:biopolymer transport protein ExbD
MKFRRRRSQNIDAIINVTSLIDVTFILLIFFMITTTFAKPNKQLPMITLPQATNVEDQKNKADIEIQIDDKGNYYVNGRKLISSDISSLSRALEKERALLIHKENVYVSIKGDDKVTYQSVVNVFDAIKNLNMGVALTFDNNSLMVSKLINFLESEKKKLSKPELTLAVGLDANSSITNLANTMEAAKQVGFQKLMLSPVSPRKEH